MDQEQESLPEFGQTDQPESSPETTESSEDTSLLNLYLKDIPPQDRDIVARYAKQWNQGATKKFQEIHGKYKPYKDLGEVEELVKYRNLANNLRANPEGFFKIMFDGLREQYGDTFETEITRILGVDDVSDEYEGEEEVEGGYEEPDQNQIIQENVLRELDELREWREQQETEKYEAEQDRQFDAVLSAMHNKFGDFDDRIMTQLLAEHGDIGKAVEDWNRTIGKFSQGSQRQAPKVLGGQGGVPSGNIDPKTLRGKDRRDLVNAWLEQASNQ